MKYRFNKLFSAVVALPTLAAVLYYGLIASDVYVSESRFVVRTPERQNSSSFGLILKNAGFSRSQDDAYVVQDYILSRDAAQLLDESTSIKNSFSSNKVDFFSRFGFLDFDNSSENFHRYYQKMVNIKLDSSSSIAVLVTHAYSAEDAYRMNQRLLEMSEKLVNQLNERGRKDLIQFSFKEVEEAGKKSKVASLALAAYRNEKGIIDPERQSTIPLQQIAKIQDELIVTKSQILQLERLAIENPQLPVLREKIKLLEREIQNESNRVAGGGERSLAGKATEFQRLLLEKEFADKILASAMSSYEQARNEAQRKQLYIERVAQPSKPDEALEPRRIRSIFSVLILGLIGWGILSMLISGIKEHQD